MVQPPVPYGPPSAQRVDLYRGQPGAVKFSLGCLMATFVLFLVPVSLVVLIGAGTAFGHPVLGAIVAAVLILGLGTLVFWVTIGRLRSAAWLEGTRLVVRGFTTRSCDLAAAPHVELDSVPETRTVSTGQTSVTVPTGRRIPRLTAIDTATGKPVRMPLVEPAARRWLDPWKLRLLADVIQSGQRPEPQARQAYWVASGLRAMSNDPTGQIR